MRSSRYWRFQGEILVDRGKLLILILRPLQAGQLHRQNTCHMPPYSIFCSVRQHRLQLACCCREFAEETMGLFGGCEVNGATVAACSKQMHAQLIQRQHVLKVVHQLKKVCNLLLWGVCLSFTCTQSPAD